jgi:hypothetical protein
MAILEKAPGLLEALRGEMTPKFLATRSPEGVPNLVPCVSILPADDQPDTLFFGNFLLRKSIRNLEQDGRLSVLVMTPELRGWLLECDFIEFQRTGAYVDIQMSSRMLRYNAYTGIRNAGVMRVRSIEGSFAISKLQVAGDYLLARLAGLLAGRQPDDGVEIPQAARREFARMVAVKALAWIGEGGYPRVMPLLSMQPTGAQVMTGWLGRNAAQAPPQGALAAANILTFEAISYQAKGRYQRAGRAGRLVVQQLFAGGPPYPGGLVAGREQPAGSA